MIAQIAAGKALGLSMRTAIVLAAVLAGAVLLWAWHKREPELLILT